MSTKNKYILPYDIHYYSKRYNKFVYVPKGFVSDGATGAIDIYTEAFFIHDWLLETKKFNDDTNCSWFQANLIMYDVLQEEGRYIRSYVWFFATTIYQYFKHIKH
jgi:hypothetical protein